MVGTKDFNVRCEVEHPSYVPEKFFSKEKKHVLSIVLGHNSKTQRMKNTSFYLIFTLFCICLKHGSSRVLDKRIVGTNGNFNYTIASCSVNPPCPLCANIPNGKPLVVNFGGFDFAIPNQGLGYDSITGTVVNDSSSSPLAIVGQVTVQGISFPCIGNIDLQGTLLFLQCTVNCQVTVQHACTTNCPSFASSTTQSPPTGSSSSTTRLAFTGTTSDPRSSDSTLVTTSSSLDEQIPSRSTDGTSPSLVLLSLLGVVPLIAVIVAGIVWIRHRKNRRNGSMGERGIDLESLPARPISAIQKVDPEDIFIPALDIVWKEPIGSGNFGQVHRGEWKGNSVALKTVPSETGSDIDREAQLLKSLQHPNIVSFYGLVSDPKSGHLSMVLEYLPQGDLGRYLVTNKDTLTDADLESICIQLLRGLVYLQSKKILHRDLAARNILVSTVDSRILVKIADFGLSRKVTKDTIYASSNHKSIPIRWSAPEVISKQIFSLASEVWSFGVVCWEIYSFGEQPFKDFTNKEVIEKVNQGYVLQRPERCPESIYLLIESCWSRDPSHRPNFALLLDAFERESQKTTKISPYLSELPRRTNEAQLYLND